MEKIPQIIEGEILGKTKINFNEQKEISRYNRKKMLLSKKKECWNCLNFPSCDGINCKKNKIKSFKRNKI